MTASKLEDGGKTKEKSPRRGKSRKSAAQIPKNATQPRQSHEGSTVIDISQTLFELFACDKCAILEDQDNPEYKYPSISGVRRHESFRRCGGEGTKAFCRPYQVCDSCYRPWFSKRAWQGHCARGCGGRPASRPRAPSSQGSVSSDEVTISAKGASGAQSQPSGNHSTYSPMFDRNNVTEMPYYATGRPVRKAGLKSHERTSSIASLLDPIPRSLPSTSKSVLQKRLSSGWPPMFLVPTP
ncbi:hypothetical protein BS47DRAFT_292471 [Hydnum rufescens UP504]|uniref:Uncharacterized protein n=1 Tax=Hydnum rufescens UP504 TaxID=1448309 RepID=A0A9P6B6D0_9AGAM|nr:hypothetical protein BS47DRAFT_292471 [Hydnum rufescens UP504]